MSSSNGGKKPASGGRGGPTIRTLADLNRRPSPSGPPFPSAGAGSDSDEPQEYYTGGEKRVSVSWTPRFGVITLQAVIWCCFGVFAMRFGGMLVQDPTNRNDVDSIFEQARERAALQGLPQPVEGQSSTSRSFTGTGRLLSGETTPSAAQPPINANYNIHFWNNGFSVDDGPLRSFEDPQNAEFIESIKKSQCPRELEPADRSSSVHVNLIKRNEDYQEPVRAPSPFQGVGRTLGSGSPSDEGSVPVLAAQESHTSSRSIGITVDDSLPFTSIQLRLADGTRMVARFNMHHTVGDIRSFIDASRPGAASAYHLQTGFPPKQLNDLTQTVEQAGLANSVIIQKM